MKRRFVWLAVAAVAIGLAVLAYRGPGRVIVRGHVGDVAAAMFVYAMVAALLRRRGGRAAATLTIAAAIELGQIAWHTESMAGQLLIGSTFDPWDLVAYAIGVAIAVGWDVITTKPEADPPPAGTCY
ncbi:MAG TPA: DUF2809 domain-containing protein [Kofleriaceae bacterium]